MSDRRHHNTILIVDDAPENIMILSELLLPDYAVRAAVNGPKALAIAMSEDPPDLILLDVVMPGMDGYEVCKRFKNSEKTKDIPVIFVTSLDEASQEAKGLELGAVDYITKPYNADIVRKRVHNHLELKKHRDHLEELIQERTAELLATRLEIIHKLGLAAEYRDNDTGMHIMRLGHYCRIIAVAYGLSNDEAELLFNTAPMHDIGKIGIPDEILLHPGPLSDKEWKLMKTHCEIGARIIGDHPSELLQTAGIIALTHHEKWNAQGYPQGLRGMDIPLYGRIVAIADVFDALTSKRPYKGAWPVEKAVDLIQKERGQHFDATLVDVFLEAFPDIISVKEKFSD